MCHTLKRCLLSCLFIHLDSKCLLVLWHKGILDSFEVRLFITCLVCHILNIGGHYELASNALTDSYGANITQLVLELHPLQQIHLVENHTE